MSTEKLTNGLQPADRVARHVRRRKRTAWILMILFVLLGAGGIAWRKCVHYRVFPKRWRTVYAGQLYRSGQLSGTLVKRVLQQHKISVVISLNGRLIHDADQNAEIAACRELGIEHYRFGLNGDGRGDIRHYAAALSHIERAMREKKPTLVHCAAGIHRTGGVLAAYRLLVRGEAPEIIYRDLTAVGSWNRPVNPELVPFLNRHMEELAELLLKEGTIERLPHPVPHFPGSQNRDTNDISENKRPASFPT